MDSDATVFLSSLDFGLMFDVDSAGGSRGRLIGVHLLTATATRSCGGGGMGHRRPPRCLHGSQAVRLDPVLL